MASSEAQKVAAKRWRQRHRESVNAYARRYYYLKDREKIKQRKAQRKIIVLTHYGGDKLACIKCGFNDIRALSIDHMNGGGNKHKRQLGIEGERFYRWLIENGYPEGYQTLCMNC